MAGGWMVYERLTETGKSEYLVISAPRKTDAVLARPSLQVWPYLLGGQRGWSIEARETTKEAVLKSWSDARAKLRAEICEGQGS